RWSAHDRVRAEIEARWTDTPERIPTHVDFDALAAERRGPWERNRSLDGLAPRTLRLLPHLLFHPADDSSRWLATDRTALGAAVAVLGRRPASIVSLLRRLLLVWPEKMAGFATLCAEVKALVDSRDSPRL